MNEVTKAQIPILGDAFASTNALMPLIRTPSPNGPAGFGDAWLNEIKERKNKYPFTFKALKPGDSMKPQEVIEEFDWQLSKGEKIRAETVITTGVGQR